MGMRSYQHQRVQKALSLLPSVGKTLDATTPSSSRSGNLD